MKKTSLIFVCVLLALFFFSSMSYSEDDTGNDKLKVVTSELSNNLKKIEEIINNIKLISVRYNKSIDSFNKSSSESSQQMINLTGKIYWLTWTIVGLTIALVILTICTLCLMCCERKEAGDRKEKEYIREAGKGKVV